MARYPDVGLSVVLPAYNEERNIETTLPRMVADLEAMIGRWEIILIDDQSKDKTFELATELSKGNPKIRLYRNEQNLRQGGTLERGFPLATLDIVTHNAMDYPFHYTDVGPVLDAMRDADVVVCTRRQYKGISLPRKFVSWSNHTLIRAAFGTTIVDYNYVQFYRNAVLREMKTFSSATSFITPEKIIRAVRAGKRVVEMEMEYHERRAGKASSATWKNVKQALRDIARLRVELWREGR